MRSETLERCRRDFPALSRMHEGRPLVFLDGPAGSQVPRSVVEAMSAYYETSNANSGGSFPTSIETDEQVAGARQKVATFLGAESADTVSFGANMTTLTFSLSRALARGWGAGDEVVITALDHEANRGPWLRLGDRGIVVREVALQPDGHLDAGSFARQVSGKTRAIAVGAASNALGTVNDLGLARRLANDVGALLIVDAVHYAPHFLVDVETIDADFLLCSAYKFYGPHVGVLYSRPGLLDRIDTDRLRTQSQNAPRRIETGTPNFAAVVGTAAAVDYIASWGSGDNLRQRLSDAMTRIGAHEREVGSYCHDGLSAIPGVEVRGPSYADPMRAPTLSVTVDGVRPESVAARLGERGIQVWDGHFYALRAVEALGLASSGGLTRIGALMYNTRDDVDALVEAIGEIATSHDA